jgi:predicted MPP superfamily phosphohydrolase
MKSRIAIVATVVQSIVLAAHIFVFETWLQFSGMTMQGHGWKSVALDAGLGLLSVSFVGATLLAFRFSNRVIRTVYKFAAFWLGAMGYLLLASVACWLVYGVAMLAGLAPDRAQIARWLFALAMLASIYAVLNASWTRVKKISVKLPNLPESWRGRVAALVSDMHLGHVRNYGFAKRIVSLISRHKPDVVFIAGDMYDGTAVDREHVAQPWRELETGGAARLGAYFISGNHEGFGNREKYLRAVEGAGVRVLSNEKVEIDGLQLVGVHYGDATHGEHFRSVLRKLRLDPSRASILLTHAPDQLQVAEEEGISLQLNGHTHGGQFLPFTWIVSRIYGEFAYGLKKLGKMLVYTSSGAGTWGPPLRLGTNPEIVLIQFERA